MMEFKMLPFDEATSFFRKKVPITPKQYRQMTDEAKARAFTVSGITKLNIIEDIYHAMDRAISEKTLFSDFKKSVNQILEKRGWAGENPYRLDTVFRTNIQQAFQAGHYRQLMEVVESRPYWQYVAVMDGRTRPSHAAMNGKVLPADDPFWKRNFPPNGFNCRCTVVSVSKSEIERDNLTIEKELPDMADQGFLNNPGEVDYKDVLASIAFKAFDREKWTPLVERGYQEEGRPALVPYAPLPAKLGPTLKELNGDEEKLRKLYYDAIGGRAVSIVTPDGGSMIFSDYLFDHLTFDGREAFFPLLREIAERPYEIWLMPMKGEKTGRIVMRKRFIKFFEDEKKRHVMLVGEYQGGACVGYTFIRGDKVQYFADQRRGWLLYGR